MKHRGGENYQQYGAEESRRGGDDQGAVKQIVERKICAIRQLAHAGLSGPVPSPKAVPSYDLKAADRKMHGTFCDLALDLSSGRCALR
jgi:hypothetical protein